MERSTHVSHVARDGRACIYIDCADRGSTRRENRIYCNPGAKQVYSDLLVRSPAETKICTNSDYADRASAPRSRQ